MHENLGFANSKVSSFFTVFNVKLKFSINIAGN